MKLIRQTYQRPVLIVLLAAVGCYGLIWGCSQHKLLYSEETTPATEFAQIAQGEWGEITIPQPPLYTWLGSVAIRVLGYNRPAMRLVGGVGFIATLLLIPLACRAYGKHPDRAQRTAIAAVIIYAIHPFALQGSLLVEPDTAIVPPALLLFAITLALSERWPSHLRWLATGLTFALLLWTKLLPTPLFIAVSALLIYALRRRLFIDTVIGMTVGLVVFAASYGGLAALLDLPSNLFAPTFNRTLEPARAGLLRTLYRALMGGGITMVWVGVPFMLLYAVAVIRRGRDVIRSRQVTPFDMLIVCSLAGLILYAAGNDLPHGFPRYHYPLFVLIVLIVSDYATSLTPPNTREKYLFLLAGLASVVYFALVIPDPLLPQYRLTFETSPFQSGGVLQRLSFALRLQVTALVIPFLALLAVLWIGIRRNARAFMGACLAFSLASWLVLTVTQTQADYATIYEYGRQGAAETSEVVRKRTQAGDAIVAPGEIIFASRREGENTLRYLGPSREVEAWLERFTTSPPAAYVLTTKEYNRYQHISQAPQVTALLDRCYTERANFGVYMLYFRTRTTCE